MESRRTTAAISGADLFDALYTKITSGEEVIEFLKEGCENISAAGGFLVFEAILDVLLEPGGGTHPTCACFIKGPLSAKKQMKIKEECPSLAPHLQRPMSKALYLLVRAKIDGRPYDRTFCIRGVVRKPRLHSLFMVGEVGPNTCPGPSS